MDSSSQILPDQTSSSQTPLRGPLLPKIVSSPPHQPKQIRRKSSFVRRVDSSEDCPSPHDSIYEAFYFSANNSDESGNRVESWPMVTLQDASSLERSRDHRVDENSRGIGASTNTSSIDDIEFRYGRGTILETITEQKSNNTMRTLARPKSADDIPSIPFLGHRDSFILAKSPRRKKSFSVDDLALIQNSYHEACSMIERTVRKQLPIPEIYAQPKTPILAPPERPPTPEGMPSWTVSQNLPPRAPSRHSSNQQDRLTHLQRVQRFFSFPANEITFSSRIPLSRAGSGARSVSAPDGRRTAPRFRPPRSAYGPIHQHPFNNATMAKPIPISGLPTSNMQLVSNLPRRIGKRKPGQRVRFTPSATARDSEMTALQNAIESSSASALHPMTPMQVTPEASNASPNARQCPHRRGRRAALKALNQTLNHENTAPPSNEYTVLSSYSPSNRSSVTPTPVPQSSLQSLVYTNSPISSQNESVLNDEQAQGVTDSISSRIMSISSTTPLMYSSSTIIDSSTMGSAPVPPSTGNHPVDESKQKEKELRCWKCRLGYAREKMDHFWTNAASCMCFVCCGIDIDEDLNVYPGNSGGRTGLGPYGGAVLRGGLRGGENFDAVRPRWVEIGTSGRQ